MHRVFGVLRVALAIVLSCGPGIASGAPPLPAGVTPIARSGPGYDFSALRPIIGRARFVAIGEQVHRSGGFYQVKTDVIRWLIREEGFRVVAMETPWFDAEETARYVGSCQGSRDEAITHVFDAYADVSTAEFLEWLCVWNAQHPDDKVAFMGFDIQQPWDDVRILSRAVMGVVARGANIADGLAQCSGADVRGAGDFVGALPLRDSLASRALCSKAIEDAALLIDEFIKDPAARYKLWLHVNSLRAWQRASIDLAGTRGHEARFHEARDAGMAEMHG